MDHLCYLFLVIVMLFPLFLGALWSPVRKGLTSWLLFVMFVVVFATIPCGILGQVRYLIVSIPDLCRLSYFKTFSRRRQNRTTSVVIVGLQVTNTARTMGETSGFMLKTNSRLFFFINKLALNEASDCYFV